MTILLLAIAVLGLSVGQTSQPPHVDIERDARAIDAMLIAPCCFSQQVSLHQSAAADEVRRDVRARLAAGETRQQILDAYVARYGKGILAEPPAAGFDLTLYIMPFLMLFASAGLLAMVLRHFADHRPLPMSGPGDGAALTPTSPDEDARLNDELRDLD